MKTSKFAQYAAEGSKRLLGADEALISSSLSFVAVMDTVTIGHIKWVGGKPVDHRMGLVADGFHAVHRNDLDDLDSKNWETDENGARIDPWQKTALLVLASPAAPHDLHTFSTSTVGGHGAVNDLCEAHAKTTEDLGQYPVVTLASDSYLHKDRKVGRVDVPVFKIVDCVEAGPFNAVVAEARGGAGFIPTSPPALGTSRIGPIAIGSGKASWGGPPWPHDDDGDDDGPLPPDPDDSTIPYPSKGERVG